MAQDPRSPQGRRRPEVRPTRADQSRSKSQDRQCDASTVQSVRPSRRSRAGSWPMSLRSDYRTLTTSSKTSPNTMMPTTRSRHGWRRRGKSPSSSPQSHESGSSGSGATGPTGVGIDQV
jgi:hypothetical protein